MADIDGTDESETLTGGAEDDDIFAELGADLARGFGGNDHINGGGGDDRLEGGLGDDTLVDDYNGSPSSPDNDTMDGGAGNDSLISYQASHFLDRDLMRGGAGDDNLICNGGQTGDSVDGGAGIDKFGGDFGGGSTIVLAFSNTSFVVQVNGINTVAVSNCETLNFVTGSANDFVTGSALHDDILSLGGADTLVGGAGDDEVGMIANSAMSGINLVGGPGEDTLLLFTPDGIDYRLNIPGRQFLQGGAKFGTISSFEALDVSAGNGNDTLIGGGIVDSINGNEGNDSIIGGAGNDTLRGGEGDDTVSGGAGDDDIVLAEGADRADGGNGNDDIFGGGTEDNKTIDGGAGNDTIGGVGDNSFANGGTGVDTLELSQPRFRYDLEYVEGEVVLVDIFETIRFSGIEFFQFDDVKLSSTKLGVPVLLPGATPGNDTLNGNNNANLVRGLGGNDTVNAAGGNDVLEGGGGNDSLGGGNGDDTMDGGIGSDTLIGGAGNDRMTGGVQNDRFVFNALSDSDKFSFFDTDVITDFVRGDRIDLSAIDANSGAAGNSAFKFIGSAAFTKLGQLRAYQSGNETFIELNATDTTSSDMTIAVEALVTFKSTDFVL